MNADDHSNGTSYRLGEWDSTGRASLAALGLDSRDALSGALSGFVEAIGATTFGERTAEDATLALPIRAEAASVAFLFLNLADSLIDLLFDADLLPGAVRIDGLLRTDEGLTAWGYLLGEATDDPPSIEPAIVEECTVVDDGPSIRIEATLWRQSVADAPTAHRSSE